MHSGHQGVPRSGLRLELQYQDPELLVLGLVLESEEVTYHGDILNVIGW